MSLSPCHLWGDGVAPNSLPVVQGRALTAAQGFLAMRIMKSSAVLGGLLLLAACGSSEPGRVQGGAAAGAATGATVGLVGGPVGVAVGAVVGGGAGAITGASTKPSQVDLGKPVWNKN